MISVGDGRNYLGLGLKLGFGGEAMGVSKVEEGKACYYQNHDDDHNSIIDPDLSLSYIDEKLQDVLGHFQKDFEGGVSAENLGAKFGGYGSFLPAYQRSPVLQHPQTPQKIHSSNSPRSENTPQLERIQTNFLVPSSASLLLSRTSTCATVASTNLFKDSANNFSKRKERMPSDQCAEESSSGCKLDTYFSQTSERSLIKVGSDNLSTQRNAETYKGLGLDISPSMSEDTLKNERSRQPFNLPEESPNSILQIMTSFPVNDNLLLSPLPHDLLYLSEKQKFQGESKHKSSRQVFDVKHIDRVKDDNKHKSSRKNDFPIEPKNNVKKDSQVGNGLILKKERHVGQLAEGRLVEDSGIGNKVKRECSSDIVKWEIVEAGSTCHIGSVDLPYGHGRSGMVFEEEKVNPRNDTLVYPRKNSHRKGERAVFSVTAKSEVCYEKKAPKTELVSRSVLNATSLEENYSASSSKKKLKGSRSQVIDSAEGAKESPNMDASLVSKGRKSAHVNIILPKSEVEDSKPQKNLVKERDTFRDFFGDAELEQDDDVVDLQGVILNDRAGEFEVVEKSKSKIPPKDYSCSKKREKPYVTEKNPKAAPTKAPNTRSGPVSKPVARTRALIPIVKENWVACDKCQKWRLLPFGMNPDNLPGKWLCSMLNWLPGMNRCTFSEEDTTKALVANCKLSGPSGGPYGSFLRDASFFDQKKKNGEKDVSASVNRGGPVSNCGKNNLQVSIERRSLNGVNRSPLVLETESQHLSKSGTLEKYRHKQKESKKPHEHNSGRGDIKRKRDAKPGQPGISKKAKVDDDWMLSHVKPLRKVGPTSIRCLPLITAGKNRHKNDNHLTRDRERDAKKKSEDPCRNFHDQSTARKRRMCERPVVHMSDLLEAASKNDDRKEKRGTVPKSVVRNETSISRGSGGSRQRRSIKEQQFVLDLGMESRKRDLGSVQLSQATLSSSKVSGSHNKITISKEVKGSPVESVSSSPLRFLNQRYSVSKRRSLDGKDDFGDVALFTTSSGPKRGCDVERTDVNRCGSMGSSGLESQERYSSHLAGSEAKMIRSSEVTNHFFGNGTTDVVHTGNQHPPKPLSLYQLVKEEQRNEKQSHTYPKKSGKDSSSVSTSKNENPQTQRDESELQVLNSFAESIDHLPSDEKRRALKNSVQAQFEIGSNIVEPALHVCEHKSKIVAENGKRDYKYTYKEIDKLDDKFDGSGKDPKQNLRHNRDEISSKRLLSHDLRLSGRGQRETEARPPRLGSEAENEAKSSVTDAIGGDTLKASKPTRRPEKQSGDQPCKTALVTFKGYKIKDVDSLSPARRDYPSQAGNSSVKEGKRLKHLPVDLKNSRSDAKSTSCYFQAALKAIHWAYLLEPCNRKSAKRGEMTMSMQVYSNTAKLCQFCAHEYEKSKDYAASALAYKLAEVAYMRVIYTSNANASKDLHELQAALQIVPLDESPSSSASDVDNLNNLVTIDKASLVNDVDIHNTAARNRPNLAGMLNFAHVVNYAMEASRKSRNAFAAAKSRSKEDWGREGITCVKKALHLNFHDVEKLIKLARLAMDAISC